MSLVSLKNEVWKIHPVYHNHSASNFARIKNTKTKRLLTGHVDKEGYTQLYFRGYPEKDSVRIAIHIFVYECFNGLYNHKLFDIDHINNDKKLPSYNYLENLQKMTRREHNIKAGQMRKLRNNDNDNKDDKYLLWRVSVDKNDQEIERVRYDSLNKLLEDGFSLPYVLKCCRGDIDKHRGYRWLFYDLPGECWVSLYDEKYDKCRVSNMGRVQYKNIISYGFVGRSGYKIKSINNIEYKVHHLICLAFNGIPSTDKHTPDHINNIVDDNRSDNLRWADKRQQTIHRSNYRKVCAFETKTGEYLKTWNTQAEAAKELNIKSPSSISDVCSGKNKSCGNYTFQYTDNNEVKNNISPLINNKKKGVQAYYIDSNNLYKEWDDVLDAADEMNLKSTRHIIRACKNKYKKCCNYNWKFIDDKNNKVKNQGKIKAYDIETGKLFKIFDNQRTASIELEINGSSISSACSGRYKTCGGYIWKYAE